MPPSRLSPLRALLVAAALSVSLPQPAGAQIVGTAARVNGDAISNLRLERYFDEYVKDKGRNVTKMIYPKVYKKLKREALDQLIERQVLWQEAKRRGIAVSDAELDAAMKEFRSRFKDEATYQAKLERSGFDEKQHREYMRQDLEIQRLLQQAVPQPVVTDAEIEAAYRDNAQRFQRPESVRARHVLVKVAPDAPAEEIIAARKRAEAVLADARAGKDFADLAERFSEDTASRGQGGDLGSFRRGDMVKPFEDVAFALNPGQISEIVETQFGFHVIKVESHTAAGVPPLDEVRERLRTVVASQKRQQSVRELVTGLVAKAKVERLVNLDDEPGR